MSGLQDSVFAELPALVPVSYPGIFRPIPPFTMSVPPLWVFGEFPDALFTFGPQPREDGAWLNVLVRHERISPDTTIVDVAQATWLKLVESTPDVILGDEWFLELREVHYAREVEFPATTKTDSITRYDTFVQHPARHATLDLFQFTWMMPTANIDEFKQTMAEILASFIFD